MRYLSARSRDVANGPGVRASIWLAGCSRHCPDCFNPEAWDFSSGKPLTQKAIDKFKSFGYPENITGFSILGGEPLQQNPNEMCQFLSQLCVIKPVWLWTGYPLNEIPQEQVCVLDYVDVLVDGPFIAELADPNLRFRGSSNQRIIDVHKTLDFTHPTLLNF